MATKTQNIFRAIKRLILIITIVEVVVLVIVGIIGWRIGWNTLDQYSQGLQLAGAAVIGLGLLGIKGNWDTTRGFEYQYSLSATEQSSLQRTQQSMIDFSETYMFLIVMLAVGILNLLIGWLIKAIF